MARTRCPAPHPVRERIEQLRAPMTAFAKDLCAIATVNPPGDRYVECAEFIAAKLRELGMAPRIVRVPPEVQAKALPGFDAYPRVSVVGRWDVGAARTLHFTGHYDVVPPTSSWKTDPFVPVIRGNRLIARGSDDMKVSLAAALFTIQAFQETGTTPPWNIEFSATPDEETGGYLGLGWLVRAKEIQPDAAVLCEGGSGTNLGIAHKGVLWLDVIVRGKPGHASNPRHGVNALEGACALIPAIKALESAYAKPARRTAFWNNKPHLRHPTIMCGGIAGGGGKVNTIPDRFHFTIDRRLNPEERLSDARNEILAVIRATERRQRKWKVEVRTLLYVPPGRADVDSEICRIAREAVRGVTGVTPRPRMTAGFTDMHFLTQDGKVPTVMYGVAGGSGAHADNEYANLAKMVETAKVYAEIITRLRRE